MSSCPHRTLRHSPSGRCHLISGSMHPLRVFSCLFLLPFFFYQKSLWWTESHKPKRNWDTPSLCVVPQHCTKQVFFSEHLPFQFNFRKFLLKLKGEEESPVILTPELSPCMCALYIEGTLQNSQLRLSLQPLPILTGTNGEDVTWPPFCGTGAFEACLRNGWGAGPA